MKLRHTFSIFLLVLFAMQINTYSNLLPPDTDSLAARLTKLENELQQLKAKPAPAPSVTVGGQAFIYYGFTTKGIDGDNYNKFDIDRMYINVNGDLFKNAKFAFTSDVFRNATTGTYYSGLSMRVKFAYLDYSPASNLSLKMGMIPNIWSGYVDKYWKYRVLSLNVTDRNSLFSSADLGLSATYSLPNKMGELSAFILNGNGYSNAEANRFKDFGARATIAPFYETEGLKGLTFCGFYYKGSNLSALGTAAQRDRFGGFLSYNYSILTASAEYVIRKDADLAKIDNITNGTCTSIFGDLRLPLGEALKDKFSIVWRYDIYDPNTDSDNNSQKLTILGLAYKLDAKITFILDYQNLKADANVLTKTDKTLTDTDTKIFLHSVINF